MSDDNIVPFGKKKMTKILRETRADGGSTHAIKAAILAFGQELRPTGTECTGFCTVFYYENKFTPGGSYISLTAVGNLNEVFADGGIKELARHTMQIFGRKPPKDKQ